jgi:uncharacterized membrane protein
LAKLSKLIEPIGKKTAIGGIFVDTRRCGKGQVAIVLSLLIPVLVGAVAFITDLTVFYLNWAQLQSGTDAAVMAGAAYLPTNPNLAFKTADASARLHGIRGSDMVITRIAPNKMSMTMKVDRSVPYYLGHLFGVRDGTVEAISTATLSAAAGRNVGHGVTHRNANRLLTQAGSDKMVAYEGTAWHVYSMFD